VLAICGGGNAGHALTVVASQNFDGDVRWLVRTPEKAAALQATVAAEGLRSPGVIKGSADRLNRISADPADVIPDADIVIVAVPAFAHVPVLTQIVPYLKETALVGCLPTRGGFEFDARRLIPGVAPNGSRVVFGLQTLPWSTRVARQGAVVNFGAVKARVMMASTPGERASEIASMLTALLGLEVVPTAGFLNMTLGNPGQFIHPGLMFSLFRSWAGEEYDQDGIPRFYADVTDGTGEFVQELSEEAVAVACEIEQLSGGRLDLSGVQSVHDWLRMSYPTQTADPSTVGSCFRTGPLQVREAPMRKTARGTFVPNFDYRYLTEDVPYGLVVTRSLAQIVGVETPAIDAVVRWTQAMTESLYLANGHVRASDVRHLPVPQSCGIDNAARLLEWYTEGA
jgi:predicted dinucleotide-binding enzyme